MALLYAFYYLMVDITRPPEYAPPAPEEEKAFSSSCMHALGGGVVGPRGSLLHYDPRCTSELKVRGRGGAGSFQMRVYLAPGTETLPPVPGLSWHAPASQTSCTERTFTHAAPREAFCRWNTATAVVSALPHSYGERPP